VTTTSFDPHADSTTRLHVVREAATMVLYVSVVEIAELVSIPEEHFSDGHVTGPHGSTLLAVIWGTAIGLALAHWFAFRVAAPGFRGETPTRLDLQIGLAQLGGAVFVAIVSSLPVFLLSDVHEQETVPDVPAAIIGILAYFIARGSGRSRLAAGFYGATALALGIVVATVKARLSAH
jgi:hypothetical protein